MSLKERVYSVLVVSSAESFNDTLSVLLPESKYSPVFFVSSISAAKRAYAEKAFDYVIINSPLPDDLVQDMLLILVMLKIQLFCL